MRWWIDWKLRAAKVYVQMKIAGACPRWLVGWCAMRVWANATQGPYSDQEVPAVLMVDALKRWDAPA